MKPRGGCHANCTAPAAQRVLTTESAQPTSAMGPSTNPRTDSRRVKQHGHQTECRLSCLCSKPGHSGARSPGQELGHHHQFFTPPMPADFTLLFLKEGQCFLGPG